MSSWKMNAASGKARQLSNGNILHPFLPFSSDTSHCGIEKVIGVGQR